MTASGSFFVNRQSAEAAVQIALPMIHEAMKKREVGESGFLYIVVMNPALTPECSTFENAILYEYAVGDRSKWDADYASFALAKARVAWRMGMDGHKVQELYPHMLTAKDTVLWGSIVLDGIIVSVSGANPWYDEAFAGTVAMFLRAAAKAGIHAARSKGLFLEEE